ncbi:MAG: sensor histidine kinase [Pyrinomonadaceae bacterium]
MVIESHHAYNALVWTNVAVRKVSVYLIALLGIAGVTGSLKLLGGHINSATVALALVLVVVFVATLSGSRPAIFASILAVISFNFFFLPPIGTFNIASPDNWVALIVFLVTAITVGQLSARARRRAEEADRARQEIEGLYVELKESFEQASRAKALEQSERLKSALLDAVTHDLRTPLTSIKASITTLLDEVNGSPESHELSELDADSRREMLQVIDEESDRLNRFVGGMIELARIEAGEMHLSRRWGAVDEIIFAALARAEPLTRGHEIQVEIENDLPVARVDSRAVSEVVYTLVDNAAKYSSVGTVLRVEAKRTDDSLDDHRSGRLPSGFAITRRECTGEHCASNAERV